MEENKAHCRIVVGFGNPKQKRLEKLREGVAKAKAEGNTLAGSRQPALSLAKCYA